MSSIPSYPFVADHGLGLLFGFCGILLSLLILSTLYHAYGSALRKLPGPSIAPFTRLYHVSMTWNGKVHEKSQSLHAKYGPVVRTGPSHVSLSDPSMIPLIFGVSSKFVKSDFYKPFDMMLDGKPLSSMFSVRNPTDHRHLKQPVAGTFALSSMRRLEPLVDECTDIFIDAMAKRSPTPVEFGAWLQWYAFDVIGSITFLKRFGFMEQAQDVNNMIENIEGGLTYLSVISYLPELHRWLLGNDKLMKILSFIPAVKKKDPFPNILGVSSKPPTSITYTETFMEVTRAQIRAYDEEQRNYARGDMLSWIREQRAKDEARMNDREVINHLTNNLLAGSDTTAISLRSVFYYSLKTPRVMSKLCQELENAERDGAVSTHVSLAEGLKLPYLQAVIKEAMRVHPGVGSPLWRITPKGGVTICGHFIPEGTEVGMSAWAVHQDKNVFGEDANIFRPERWLDADQERIAAMDRAFLSFGFGARTCIGKNISIMEMSKFVPQVLRKFELEWAGPNEEWNVATRWFAQQTGINIIFRPKSQPLKA